MTPALACHRLSKAYGRPSRFEVALYDVSVKFAPGECCVLLGPSGSGKTTLLSIVGCLLSPTYGTVEIDGTPVDYGNSRLLTRLRRRHLGFVFQHSQLLPFLTVGENLTVVAHNAGLKAAETRNRIGSLLDTLAIARYARSRPRELSGGQRQRVSIARAILHRPRIILADEPTAALDWKSGRAATELLVQQARESGALLIVVTHDTRLTDLFDRAIHLESGRVKNA
jgi:ABC-type lipoprotein export system ATPase subunit